MNEVDTKYKTNEIYSRKREKEKKRYTLTSSSSSWYPKNQHDPKIRKTKKKM